jgi:hypothetical protein
MQQDISTDYIGGALVTSMEKIGGGGVGINEENIDFTNNPRPSANVIMFENHSQSKIFNNINDSLITDSQINDDEDELLDKNIVERESSNSGSDSE